MRCGSSSPDRPWTCSRRILVDNGLTQVISVKATIDGDRATATMDVQNEVLGRQTVTLPLVREDGWKVCQVA